MNKFVIVFLLALISSVVAPRISAFEFQRVINPNLILPSSTPVPTKPVFKLPSKNIIPLVTLAVTPSGTPTPSLTPTPTVSIAPTVTGSPIGSTGKDIITEVKESGSTGMGVADETNQVTPVTETTQTIDKNLVILVLGGLVIFLLIATQWAKIKVWMHKKTE